MVTLVCDKQKCKISELQAQSRLQIQKAMGVKGWELPKDSPYEFIDNALIKRADTKNCTGQKKSKRDPAGSRSPRKATLPHGDDSKET